MPEYTLDDPYAAQYPQWRDAHGVPLGEVEPGEIRDLDEVPPDGKWRETTDEDRARRAAREGDEPATPADDTGGEGTGGEESPGDASQDATSPGPVPAPPAVIPGT